MAGRYSYKEKPKTQGPDAWHSDNEFVHRLSQYAAHDWQAGSSSGGAEYSWWPVHSKSLFGRVKCCDLGESYCDSEGLPASKTRRHCQECKRICITSNIFGRLPSL